jgi:hypothetical protein
MADDDIEIPDGPSRGNDGATYWHKNGKLHRDDGPAAEWPNGQKAWYREGLIHREDGPAIIMADGKEYWVLNDETTDETKVAAYRQARLLQDQMIAKYKDEQLRQYHTGLEKPITVGKPLKLKKPGA